MIKRLAILILLGCAGLLRADTTNYVATVTFTNVINGVTNGDSITINGDTRYYTNGTLADPTIWILSTNIVGHAATNTVVHLSTYPVANVDYMEYNGTNAFDIRSQIDETLTVSLSSGVGTVSYVTNVYQAVRPLVLPIDGLLVASTRTNAQNRLVDALNLSYATGKVSAAAAIMTNFVNLFASQTLSNKFVFSLAVSTLNATNGTLSGQHITNATLISGTFGMTTNGTFQNPTINQAVSISGNLGSLTNGTSYGLSIVNAAALSGIATALTNGYWTNAILGSPTFTNAVNYGNAISSPGSGSSSEQFGTGALATNTSAFAAGNLARAGGEGSTALGNAAIADFYAATVTGTAAEGNGTNVFVYGTGSQANALNSGVLGAFSIATYSNSVVIGTGITSTETNQIIIGNSMNNVQIQGTLYSATTTNSTWTGTNHLHGAWSLNRRTDATQPTGHNIVTNSATDNLVWLTAPSGTCTNVGFTDGWDGRVITYVKYNGGYNMGIANESGLASAERRVYTGTGADVTITNSPGWFKLLYDATLSRWILLGHSN